jgi:hypothetical protein
VPAILGTVWWFTEAAMAHRQAPNATYDNPIPPLLILAFGWPALIVLARHFSFWCADQ